MIWKKFFWMGAADGGLDAFTMKGNFIVIVLNIMLSFQKNEEKERKKVELIFSGDNEIRIEIRLGVEKIFDIE